ncbi:hypothetical protein PsorP6_007483 [Peronosclerospora sorghi]|uniref:Uncharacterized protein n=1 Tax=Peronosclerospora sorghi TaxID=230839 RepID=A0ACC0WAP0_9STRA|nr:hypothetical protein PsorP6_007483 [Peronosclerospora sorghi]
MSKGYLLQRMGPSKKWKKMVKQSNVSSKFKHIKSSIGAYEAEEVGVEHLLRDVNDPSVNSLAGKVKHKMTALNGLRERLEEMKTYLENVGAGRLPPNHQIICNMQTIFNLLPNLNVDELVRSMFVKTNDMHFVIYLSSLIRCTIALHNLVNNKIKYKESEDVGITERKDVALTDKASKDKTSEKFRRIHARTALAQYIFFR